MDSSVSMEAVLLAYLVLFAIIYAQSPVGRLLNHPVLRHLGVISYGLYLWQQLFDGPGHLFHGLARLLGPLAILACAEISYFLVEKPSFRLRDMLLARSQTTKQSHQPG